MAKTILQEELLPIVVPEEPILVVRFYFASTSFVEEAISTLAMNSSPVSRSKKTLQVNPTCFWEILRGTVARSRKRRKLNHRPVYFPDLSRLKMLLFLANDASFKKINSKLSPITLH